MRTMLLLFLVSFLVHFALAINLSLVDGYPLFPLVLVWGFAGFMLWNFVWAFQRYRIFLKNSKKAEQRVNGRWKAFLSINQRTD
jgi:hypothetical protein